MKSLIQECMMCGSVNAIEVSREAYEKHQRKADFIQNIFPELNPMEREFIKSGYCPECQSLLFGTNYTSKRIHRA